MTTIRSRIFRCRGFTLVEMAIVLAIMVLIIGSGLTLLSAQQDQRRIEDTNAMLSDARETLIGFALSQPLPHLPCPDRTSGTVGTNFPNDGVEDRTVGVCDVPEGNLPWVTLGLTPQIDAWSDRLRYRVTAAFSSSTGMQLTSAGNIEVRDDAAVNIIASGIPAIILSHGKNGFGAINAACNPVTCHPNPAPPAASPDELANAPTSIVEHTTFVSHSPTPAGAVSSTNAAVGYFDDQVTWLSPNILFNRMVQAGKLPLP